MFKRDFTKSNIEYIKKNKIVLICLSVFLVLGIILACCLGFNGNYQMKGYNEFSVTLDSKSTSYSKYAKDVSRIVNSYGGKYDTFSVYGKGDDTKLVIRYMNDLSSEDKLDVNIEVAETLEISIDKVSAHTFNKASVNGIDYLYTIMAILIVVMIATLFAYFRYYGASALAVIISNAIGILTLLSINSILRLQVGISFFALLVLLTIMITYFVIDLSENIKAKGYLINNDYNNAITDSVNSSKFRFIFASVALFVVGLLFVLIAPSPIKYISLNLLFIGVVSLFAGLYVAPFVWSMAITHCKKKVKKEVKEK